MYEEVIHQIQDLNQKLIDHDVYAGGLGYYKILDEIPFAQTRNVYFTICLEDQKKYLIEFAHDLDAVDLQKYLRRALFLMVLEHEKGLITAKDFSIDPSRCFMVMDWVEGVNLQSILRHKKLNLRESLCILADLTYALEHLGEFGFVHRNITPNCITIQKGTGRSFLGGVEYVTLSDFVHTRLEVNDFYSSPELVRSMIFPDYDLPLTPWSDIYSIGAIFYQMIMGEPPFPKHKNLIKWTKRPPIPRIESPLLSRRERKYCQELINNTMHRNFLKRWSPLKIRGYIMAYLEDVPREKDMERWI
ncbi:MAG: protein kinase [Planctomycetes bacterium]|nr:protein kinase [Planctomycetota bacterium]HON44168.1 protein kinase [Planctomycetota bacterium]HPY75253.1 protein kinase [Planctomycetota bacterium]HQB00801.1 protein kinase [Planctomycetota bacterium]HRU52635.1 protein kinase [Planctomycetota bacterium]